MGRIYSVPFAVATVTNAGGNNDLWLLVPGDDKPIRLRGFVLGQTSELSDAAEEAVSISVIHLGATVTGGDGGAVTPSPMDVQLVPAAGFTAEVNGPGVATTDGTSTILDTIVWNLRNSPYEHWYPDRDMCPAARQAAALVIRLNTTVADDISFGGTAYVEED